MKLAATSGYERLERASLRGGLRVVYGYKSGRRELVEVSGPNSQAVGRALKLSRAWHGAEAERISVRSVPDGSPSVLVELGELTDIGYRSGKWGHRPGRYYTHRTRRPRPSLCATPDGRQLVVVGGGIRVRSEGLVG